MSTNRVDRVITAGRARVELQLQEVPFCVDTQPASGWLGDNSEVPTMPPECIDCGNDEAFIIRHTIDEVYMYGPSGLSETEFIEEIEEEWVECNECGSRDVEMNF